jgi:hypothetical protein
MARMLLLAAVVLASVNVQLGAMELLQGDSELQRTWDSAAAQISELHEELDGLRKEEALERLKEVSLWQQHYLALSSYSLLFSPILPPATCPFLARASSLCMISLKILGIRGRFKKDGYKDAPPQFMTELYHTVTDSKGKTRGKNPYNANIVRSFTETGMPSFYSAKSNSLKRCAKTFHLDFTFIYTHNFIIYPCTIKLLFINIPLFLLISL